MSPEGGTYTGRANLAQTDYVVTVEIGITVTLSLDGAERQWRGWYRGADLATEPQPGPASITLDIGTSGEIDITHARRGTGEGTFTGVGEPPAG